MKPNKIRNAPNSFENLNRCGEVKEIEVADDMIYIG